MYLCALSLSTPRRFAFGLLGVNNCNCICNLISRNIMHTNVYAYMHTYIYIFIYIFILLQAAGSCTVINGTVHPDRRTVENGGGPSAGYRYYQTCPFVIKYLFVVAQCRLLHGDCFHLPIASVWRLLPFGDCFRFAPVACMAETWSNGSNGWSIHGWSRHGLTGGLFTGGLLTGGRQTCPANSYPITPSMECGVMGAIVPSLGASLPTP